MIQDPKDELVLADKERRGVDSGSTSDRHFKVFMVIPGSISGMTRLELRHPIKQNNQQNGVSTRSSHI